MMYMSQPDNIPLMDNMYLPNPTPNIVFHAVIFSGLWVYKDGQLNFH